MVIIIMRRKATRYNNKKYIKINQLLIYILYCVAVHLVMSGDVSPYIRRLHLFYYDIITVHQCHFYSSFSMALLSWIKKENHILCCFFCFLFIRLFVFRSKGKVIK